MAISLIDAIVIANYLVGIQSQAAAISFYLSSMQVTVEIPDDMAQKITPAGRVPARTLLEAVA